MARPQKNTVDYFPFYCEDGNKMFYIEETYGNDGFATFVKLLRELAKKEYHYLDLSNKTTLMYLAAKCKVSKEVLEAIINDLCELGKFNTELWNENKIIWCQDFVDSIQDAYERRNNKCITLDGLCALLLSLGIRKPSKCTIKGDINTQTILKEIKEEKERTKSKHFVPPTLLEVIEYFKENNFTEQLAEKAFKYYDVADWKDSKGNQVKNWKQKMQSVWFKDENRISQPNQQNIQKYTDPSEIDLKTFDWSRMPIPEKPDDQHYMWHFQEKWRMKEIWTREVAVKGYRTNKWW